jgi:putative membrane protein
MFKASSIAGAVVLPLAAAMIATACNDLDEPVASAATDAGQGAEALAPIDAGTDAPSVEDGAVAPTTEDPAIAQVLLVANLNELAQGELAQRIAVAHEVQIFASSMATVHTAILERENALFQALGLTPRDSETSRQLQADSDTLYAQMLTLQGNNIDRFFIGTQVGSHADLIELIDSQLLPAATAPALVTELETLRIELTAHLDAARELQVR